MVFPMPAVKAGAPAPVVVTAAMKAKAVDNLRKAKVKLVVSQPFFASIALKRTIDIRDDVPTAYVTAAGKIVLGTAFTAGLNPAQVMFLLAHESMHYAMLHHLRIGHRKPKQANIAMDKVINDILLASGMTEHPPEGVFQEGARDYAWEQLYDDGDKGDGGDEYRPGNGNDDLSGEGIGGVTAEKIEEIKRELIQARQAAKNQGNLPAGLERLIDGIINPSTPWFPLLERYMLQLIKAGTSWRRPNKRFIGHDLYLPSTGLEPKMGTLVIQSDESGSVSKEEREHFGGHVNKLIEQCRPEKVILLHVDTEVHDPVEEFTPEDWPIEFRTYACGGTDMTAGFRWVEENGIEPDCFVCLTDGETPFGGAPGYPVIWLITGDAIAPHGETIPYSIVEEEVH